MSRPARIREWEVFLVPRCRHTVPVKSKFVVIVATAPDFLGVLINSGVTEYAKNNEKLLKCYASVSADEHSFLQYNSLVACDRLFPFTRQELTLKKGCLSPAARRRVKNAAQKCPMLERKQKILVNKAHASHPGD
ncbi:MAG: hypothetical protein OXU31_01380 [Gammaproteobacteria bacterium]|nr:hypothetical protein [Gammaproteobacteria bacterium]